MRAFGLGSPPETVLRTMIKAQGRAGPPLTPEIISNGFCEDSAAGSDKPIDINGHLALACRCHCKIYLCRRGDVLYSLHHSKPFMGTCTSFIIEQYCRAGSKFAVRDTRCD